MDETERLLGQIGDEMSAILFEGMRVAGDLKMMLDVAYHVIVNGIEERDNLPDENIVYEDKIYDRQIGLKVYVQYPLENYDKEKAGVYELKDGITNENWVKI